jgi:hypothetical protein
MMEPNDVNKYGKGDKAKGTTGKGDRFIWRKWVLVWNGMGMEYVC